MIHKNKYNAIIEWINCFSLPKAIESLSQLSDGTHLLQLLQTKHPDLTPPEESPEARFKVIQDFLTEQYGGELAILRNEEMSLARGVVLLLTALVQPPHLSSTTLAALTALPEPVQLEIQDCLSTLLAPLDQPDSLGPPPPDLGTLLARSCSSPPPPTDDILSLSFGTPTGGGRKRSHQQRESGPFRLLSSESQIFSPIKAFLDSPHVIRKLAALQEREQEIVRLRQRLSEEIAHGQDLDMDLSQATLSLQEKEKEIGDLRRTLQELKEQLQELEAEAGTETACQSCLVSWQKLRDLEEYKSANLYLTSEVEQLHQRLEYLQKQVEQSSAIADSQQVQEANCHNALLQGQVSDLQTQLEAAQAQLKQTQSELASILDFYSERSSNNTIASPKTPAPVERLDQSLKIAELEQDLSQLLEKERVTAQTLEVLHQDLEESEKTKQELQFQLETKLQDESILKQRYEEEVKTKKSLLQEKSYLISKLSDLSNKFTDIEKYADDLFCQNQELQERVHGYTVRIGQLEEELAIEQAQKTSLAQQNSALKESCSSYQEEIYHLQRSLEEAQTNLCSHQEKIKDLEHIMTLEKAGTLEKMHELKQEYAKDKDFLNEQLKNATEIGDNLKQEIATCMQELTNKSTEVAQLEENLSSLNMVIERQHSGLESQQQVLNKMEDLNKMMALEKEKALEKITNIQDDLRLSQSDKQLLTSQILDLEAQLASVYGCKDELAHNLSKASLKCQESESREESLKVQLAKVTQFLEEKTTKFEQERTLNSEEVVQKSEEILNLNNQKQTLETQLLFMQECDSQMKQKLQDLEKEFSYLVTTNISLESVEKENEEKIAAMEVALTGLRAYARELEEKIRVLQIELSQEGSRSKELEKENNALLAKYAEYQDLISFLEKDLGLARNSLAERQARIDQLNSMLDLMKEESCQRDEALSLSQSTISQMKELASRRESAETELEAQKQLLESQLIRLEHQVASRELEIKTLRLQLKEAQSLREQEACTAKNAEHQLSQLRQEHHQVLQAKQGIEIKNEELQVLCQKLEMKLDEEKVGLLEKMKNTENDLLSKQNHMEKLTHSLHSLGLELGEMRGRLEKEEARSQSLQGRESELKAQLAASESRAREEKEAACLHVQASLEEVESLRRSNNLLQHQLALINTDLDNTRRQLLEARDQSHHLSLTVDSLQLKQVTLQDSLASQEMLLTQREHELTSDHQQALAEKEELLTQLQEQLIKLQKEMDTLTKTSQTNEKKLKEELGTKELDCQTVLVKVTALEEELFKQTNQYNALKHQTKEQVKSLAELQKQLADKEKLAAERLVKYEKAKKYIAQMESQKDRNSKRSEEMKDLQHNLEKVRSQLESQQKAAVGLQIQLEGAQAHLIQKDAVLHKLAQEKRSLETQLAFSDSQIQELRGKLDPSNRRHTMIHPASSLSYTKVTAGERAVHQKEGRLESSRLKTSEMSFLSTTKDKENLKDYDTTFESFNTTLNSSVIPAAMAGKFECEDEEGEFMDPRHLAGLKSGEIGLMTPNERRLTELQRRNTLCLPHLKSSYPAEMQSHVRFNEKSVLREANPTLVPASKRKHNVQDPSKDKVLAFKMNKAKDTVPLTRFQPRGSTASLRESSEPNTPTTRPHKSNFKTPNSIKRLFNRKK